jgi:hypothetical protein
VLNVQGNKDGVDGQSRLVYWPKEPQWFTQLFMVVARQELLIVVATRREYHNDDFIRIQKYLFDLGCKR